MASNGQQENIGDDAPAGSGRPIDLDIEGDNHNTEARDQGHRENDIIPEGDTSKKTNQGKYYNKTISRYGGTGAYAETRK